MRRLVEFEHDGLTFAVDGSDWSGLEEVRVDDRVVSAKRSFGLSGSHRFSLAGLGDVELTFRIQPANGVVDYALCRDGEVLTNGAAPLTGAWAQGVQEEQEKPSVGRPDPAAAPRRRSGLSGHAIALVGGALKLLKSANAVKVALAGSAFAGWSLLLDWRFAVIILSIIIFHEYGHVWAMKRCGIPTKGFYLIPFVGGVALGEKARSYWHEVYVAMMGPVFGLLLSLVTLIAYWVTGFALIGLAAAFGALINLLNLLPVYPLDGGHVLKAAALSVSPSRSFWLLLSISVVGVFVTARLGFYLIPIFLVLGAIDLIATRRAMANAETIPMDSNGVVVSLLWYVAVVAAFVIVIVTMAATDVPGSEIPKIILSD